MDFPNPQNVNIDAKLRPHHIHEYLMFHFRIGRMLRVMIMWSVFIFVILRWATVATEANTNFEVRADNRIIVAFSEQKPFAELSKGGLVTGLEVIILDNFAKKYNLQMNYCLVNGSLNCILRNQDISVQLSSLGAFRLDKD